MEASIKVGMIAEQTGPLAFMGIANANVAKLVVDDINSGSAGLAPQSMKAGSLARLSPAAAETGSNPSNLTNVAGTLFFVANDGHLTSVAIHASTNGLEISTPVPLFQTRLRQAIGHAGRRIRSSNLFHQWSLYT